MAYNIGDGIDLRSSVKDEQLLGVLVGFEDCVDVSFVLSASLDGGPKQRLTAASDGGVGDGVEPRENLCNQRCVHKRVETFKEVCM